MDKKPSLNKAEIVLIILLIISGPLYALALIERGIFGWCYVGCVVVTIAWMLIFVLPNLLKRMKQERQQKK